MDEERLAGSDARQERDSRVVRAVRRGKILSEEDLALVTGLTIEEVRSSLLRLQDAGSLEVVSRPTGAQSMKFAAATEGTFRRR